MHPIRTAAFVLALLAIHIAVDGAAPLLLGWKVKLGMIPFLISGVIVIVSLILSVMPSKARAFGFAVACVGVFISAASLIVPVALDGEFAPSAYPYPGGRLFGLIQFVGFVACIVLLLFVVRFHRLASRL